MISIRKIINEKIFFYLEKKIKDVEFQLLRQDLLKRNLLEIGEGTYGRINVLRNKGSDSKISIGKYCSIASNVTFITGGIHPVDWVSLYPFRINWQLENAYNDGMPSTNGPIIIGNDVWISTGVTILSGVKIGDGAVIASNSLVTKDIPNYAIVAGVPARLIKYRFSDEQIARLEKIQWWNWPKDKIKDAIPLLSSKEIDNFININECN